MSNKDKQTVAVLGASPKSERYSNKAIVMLQEYGHKVIPINPAHKEILGIEVVPNIGAIKQSIDTLTVYISPEHSSKLVNEIISLNPKRVILNPGAESTELGDALTKANIPVVEACTLVMLRTEQF